MADDGNSELQKLLSEARGGDTRARDELFSKCRNYVSVIARAQVETSLRTKVDASDLVQQTLLEAHRAFMNFRGETEAEWLAWLRRILAHNATDFVRHYKGTDKRQAGREVALNPQSWQGRQHQNNDPLDPGESPSQVVMRHEREVLVADAISQLAEDHQEVIILRNLQQLPFDEIATRMGRSGPAVQMLWTRAIRKLQELLKSSPGTETSHES